MTLLKRTSYWQRRLAAWIGKKSERLSGKGKKIVLLAMLLPAGSYCFYLIISAFTIGEKQTSYTITRVSVPQHIEQTQKMDHPENSLERIHRIYLYLDHLAKTPSLRPVYDSIDHSRPGLLDSIMIMENIYQSQIKKEK